VQNTALFESMIQSYISALNLLKPESITETHRLDAKSKFQQGFHANNPTEVAMMIPHFPNLEMPNSLIVNDIEDACTYQSDYSSITPPESTQSSLSSGVIVEFKSDFNFNTRLDAAQSSITGDRFTVIGKDQGGDGVIFNQPVSLGQNSTDFPVYGSKPLTPPELATETLRKMKSRESSRRYRQRRLDEIVQLAKEVERWKDENAKLRLALERNEYEKQQYIEQFCAESRSYQLR
jgi:superoxide dismutase